MTRALLATLLLAAACGAPMPRPIAYGAEACAHCHMTIMEPRSAAELVSRKGRTWAFDDPVCLAAFYAEGTVPRREVASVWVNDFVTPDSLLDATRAVYLRTERVSTPMGGGIIALRPGREADSVRAELGGAVLDWPALVAAGGHR
ncbi:MAG TPA: nitrous oxide reductase accessory protein NosL [Gemmatimonadales bacterium]|nr:nitrous oxide reductase accessory protein NosL [Gemmatimonadales bacterium]